MITKVATVLLVGLCCSCEGAPRDRTDQAVPDDVKSLLVAAVGDSVERSEYGSAFDSSKLQFSEMQSETVPDLHYHWARYTPEDLSAHGAFTAVAISRSGSAQLLTGSEPWIDVVNSWLPESSAAASAMCSEIVAFTRPEADPERMPIVYRDSADLMRPFVFVDTPAARETLTRPRVSEPRSSQFATELWVIEIGGARQYSCLVEHDGTSLNTIKITLLSEEPGVGLTGLGS